MSESVKRIQYGIKGLLAGWQNNTIKTAKELKEYGFYNQILNKYSKSGWLENPAYGIYKKSGSKISWPSAINVLQKQNFPAHVASMSALKLHGIIQYLIFNEEKERLFILNTSNKKKELPKWFSTIVESYEYNQIHLFDKNKYGFVKYSEDNILVTISSQERAILEMLAVMPKYISYDHAYELVEGAVSLRPECMQQLLEDCLSYKVKRLFLYLAEKHNLPCFEYLNTSKIDIGTGDRLIAGGGKYSSKYKISVPQIFGAEDEGSIGSV